MIPDQIIRSKRRTLSITVDGCGRVVVRAPRSCSDERIFSFLQSQQNWIEKRVQKAKARCAFLPQANLDGYVFSLLGTWEMVRAMGDRLTGFVKCVAYAFSICLTPVFCFLGGAETGILVFLAALLVLLDMVFAFERATVETTAASKPERGL